MNHSASNSAIANVISHHSHRSDHLEVHFKLDRDKVILEGQVNSFFEKQSLQESIRKINRDYWIQNELKVLN